MSYLRLAVALLRPATSQNGMDGEWATDLQ